ncbi:hypothetical protein Aab01nite_38160 [Paractinoplanes abujensis]|uniref:Uncharacterized protein n=1 Tax=Paractinoplanes abujensis TaxID=882441 RepID=A0A7W7CTS6_9ACTN|nr:hypothetical protein [Actinoplanes abujensis]MBB4694560.1 hypothetical protein [Actinoplanes abujensis]GID20226.1 hypothetical protein Aab01nite_38160 [Actinoplanes abujensis]
MTERENETVPTAETPGTALPAIAGPAVEEPPVDQDDAEPGPSRGACRTELRGWAGAHLHGAVRPRRRAAGRGRPPGRWC